MLLRASILGPILLQASLLCAQPTLVQKGEPFTRSLKGSTGDLYTVVDGLFAADGRHVLFVEEGLTPKVVRLNDKLVPSEELVLKDLPIDGGTWTAVAPVASQGSMRCLFVSTNKKESTFGVGSITTTGALAVESIRKLTTFELPYINDPAHTLAVRPQPDPILFTRGLAFAQQERLIASPDGAHFLLNHHSHKGKGNKRFSFAYLDNDLKVQWEGNVELPFADNKSTIHQIALGNDGTIVILTYFFACKSEEEIGDKACHELYLSLITGLGKESQHVLLEKGFVSSARILPRADGRVAVALRYGALTGIPGQVVQFDPKDPKLKPTPILMQRLPTIKKTKLLAFGDPSADPKKPLPRAAKVPNEIVALHEAPDQGLVITETFLDQSFQLPVGDAIAIRTLSGHVRMSHVGTNDSISWQQQFPRALMTTAGLNYQGVAVARTDQGTWLFHGQTPKGFEAILRSGNEGSDGTGPQDPQVLRAVLVDAKGEVLREGTALLSVDTFVPSPMGILKDPGSGKALVKMYDRGTGYRFVMVDLDQLGDQ